MLITPRYVFRNWFDSNKSLFESLPNEYVTLAKGDVLWHAGSGVKHIFYIESGIASVSVAHEEGYQKLLYLLGPGIVYPGCHLSDFKIERAIETIAITDIVALKFDRTVFHNAVMSNPAIAGQMLELYASWINLHIFESAHQSLNTLNTKLCNLLYLLNSQTSENGVIPISQNDIASILSTSRESVSRKLNKLAAMGIVELRRNHVRITDERSLMKMCSYETLPL